MHSFWQAFTWWSFAGVLLSLGTAPGAEPREFRAARSVHLFYPAPEGLVFYNEMVVEKSVDGSYFMACGWNTGYFGIQQLNGVENKVVIFSVWDPTKGDDPGAVKTEDRVEVLYEGAGVRIKRFGGEGTGGQCLWKHSWQPGETNRFIVAASVEGQKTSYAAWFGASNGWKKLATFRTRTQGKPLKGYYSFVEDFRRDYKSAHEQRRARYGNGWVRNTSGGWAPLFRARFSASGAEWESKENIDAGSADGWFYLATGGNTVKSRDLQSMISLPVDPVGPKKLPNALPPELVSAEPN